MVLILFLFVGCIFFGVFNTASEVGTKKEIISNTLNKIESEIEDVIFLNKKEIIDEIKKDTKFKNRFYQKVSEKEIINAKNLFLDEIINKLYKIILDKAELKFYKNEKFKKEFISKYKEYQLILLSEKNNNEVKDICFRRLIELSELLIDFIVSNDNSVEWEKRIKEF